MGTTDETAWRSPPSAEPPQPPDPQTAEWSETVIRPGPARSTAQAAAPPAEPVPPPLDGERVGRYVRGPKLGAGAMGEVWKAYDPDLRRWVALKLLAHDDPDLAARFRLEAQAAASLVHPNIVAIHEVGQHAGRPFLAMQYVEGHTLEDAPRDVPRRLVAWVRDAAFGVQHAHERGIVHRDLKPANLMVGADDRLYVMDFGLAKRTTVDVSLSVTGTILGTPAYMSPEQARGSPQVDARADVYSLGATLYDLLAGDPPFDCENLYELLKQVETQDPPPLTGVASDLATVVMKCLEKEPARRYASARELGEDLDRWLRGHPILARPPSFGARVGRWLKRRRSAAIAAAACLLGVAATVGTLLPRWRAAELRAAQEREAMQRLERARPVLDRAVFYGYRPGVRHEELARRATEAREGIVGALALAPHLPIARLLLGRAWEIEGWEDRAEAEYRRAIDADPGFGPAHFALGRLLLLRSLLAELSPWDRERAGKESEARKLAREAQAGIRRSLAGGSGWDDDLQRTLADATLGYLERRPDLSVLLAEGIRRFEDREGVEDLVLLAALTEQGAARLGLLDEVLRRKPGHALALFFRGTERYHRGQAREAADDLSAAIRLQPRFGDAFLHRGVARKDLGDLEGAHADYTRALELPTGFSPYGNRALVAEARGDWAGAVADWDAFVRAHPWHVNARVLRGKARSAARDAAGAIRDLTETLAAHPNLAGGYCARAEVHRAAGNLPGAIADFSEAIRIDPRFAAARNNRGETYAATGRLDDALADFHAAVELAPTDPMYLTNRGSVRYMKRDLRGAQADWARALECAPPDWPQRGEIRSNLEAVKRQLGE